ILDDIRARLAAAFKAADGSLSLAISGTGTSGMEAAVGTLARPGTRAVAVVTGYFGDRLAQMLQRHGAEVTRVDVEWGRACDPARLESALGGGADLVTMVHAETSTGVLNPVAEMCALASARGAMTIVDAVTGVGVQLLPPAAERLWSLNAVSVPAGIDEARLRKRLLEEHGIEIGAGLGPLAGKIWRVGLMGSGSTPENITRLTGALKALLA